MLRNIANKNWIRARPHLISNRQVAYCIKHDDDADDDSDDDADDDDDSDDDDDDEVIKWKRIALVATTTR